MPWVSRLLRGSRVWTRAGADGQLAAGSDGRVDVLYKKGGKVYRAAARNLEVDPDEERWSDEEAAPAEGAPASGASGAKESREPAPPPEGAFVVYADGACTGNPGPAGIGVVLLDGTNRRELSEFLGEGTNNIAELTAIVRALELAPRERTVVIHSDSAYALGLLGKGWKAKANQSLVEKMRELAKGFRDLRLVKVAGHAGVVENERADMLARMAVERRESVLVDGHARAPRLPPAEKPTPRGKPPF